MNVTMTVRDIIDTIQEVIILKSGMYLNYDEIKDILKKIDCKLSDVLLKHEVTTYHRFRPEEIEFVINEIRVHIGELSDSNPFTLLKIVKNFPEHQDEFMMVVKELSNCMDWHRREYGLEKPLGKEFVQCLVDKSGTSRKVADLVFYSIAQNLNRSISYEHSIKNWDGVVKLSDLFESEVLPKLPDKYFDQRYIDYLSKNTNSLYGINWRQFEGLTAEFFNRNGFEINLGKGRKDGGIDVYATDSKTGQLLIIQCKRYSKNSKVDVNVVKALYFDVVDKKADHALLATTSEICSEGKRITARNYPISLAEHNNIVEWVKSMETADKL
ncbi:restriction endonuclease [Alkaliphilus transvaalensis]|uniref:restriction endonuclease n=1 Tax=Alkaliphilus transvaalensis TaxID=114628 RepID=UPI00068786C8|nr:restriction endonuclease [Alkaliphilus transvaalensis]